MNNLSRGLNSNLLSMMFGTHSKNSTSHLAESLEPRAHLAADLTAAIVAPIAGQALGYGIEHRALITVVNSGDSTPRDQRIGVALFASADETLDPSGDIQLGSRTISRLSARESETEDIEFTLSGSTALSGNYRLYAVVDTSNIVAESNENNNISAPVNVTIGTGGSTGGNGGEGGGGGGGGGEGGSGQVDLSVTLVTPTNVVAGNEIETIVRVQNNRNGSVLAGTRVAVYSLRANALTADTSQDTLLGIRSLSEMSGGELEVEDVEFVLPRNTANGLARWYAVIDTANTVTETDETNNISPLVEVNVTAPTVDLSASVTRITAPGIVVQGTRGSSAEGLVRFTVINNGTESLSRGTSVISRAYLRPVGATDDSRDVSASDAKKIGASNLSSSSSRSGSMKVRVPTNAASGEYELIIKIDDNSGISEVNERNNTIFTGRTVSVATPTVDAAIGGVISRQPRGNRPGQVSLTVSNLGNSTLSSRATVQLFFVSSEGVEVSAGRDAVRSLSLKPGRISIFKMNFNGAVPAGNTLVARIVTNVSEISTVNNSVTVVG